MHYDGYIPILCSRSCCFFSTYMSQLLLFRYRYAGAHFGKHAEYLNGLCRRRIRRQEHSPPLSSQAQTPPLQKRCAAPDMNFRHVACLMRAGSRESNYTYIPFMHRAQQNAPKLERMVLCGARVYSLKRCVFRTPNCSSKIVCIAHGQHTTTTPCISIASRPHPSLSVIMIISSQLLQCTTQYCAISL